MPVTVDPPGVEGRPGTEARRVVHEVAHSTVRVEDLRALRTDLVAWVRATAGLPDDEALADRLEDVATAFYEALANVVDHAYPEGAGPVDVSARLATAGGPEQPWLEIVVADHGGWRPAPPDPGHRGRGLLLVSRLTDGHELSRVDDGTRLRLWWHRPPSADYRRGA
ncbi:ATP-binding protein [Actinomycetospora lemnae]|uniref:ATP-binding protein n=1 Tax=Actinomycetospora lemnae TaxID=3019891 RepID=A0ABT5SW09_9PSEU|nr:ATP-binding protein [Actinomycetospora sp. DW7H6]MDD7966331.1 ATP-binding protein [Actinomycetospora sp. DW7H6]